MASARRILYIIVRTASLHSFYSLSFTKEVFCSCCFLLNICSSAKYPAALYDISKISPIVLSSSGPSITWFIHTLTVFTVGSNRTRRQSYEKDVLLFLLSESLESLSGSSNRNRRLISPDIGLHWWALSILIALNTVALFSHELLIRTTF